MEIRRLGAWGPSESWLVLPALEALSSRCVRLTAALRSQAREETPDWSAFAGWSQGLVEGHDLAWEPTLDRLHAHHLPALDALIPPFTLCLERVHALIRRIDLPHSEPHSSHFLNMLDQLHRSSLALNGLVAEMGNPRDGSGLLQGQRALVACRKEAMAEHLAAIGDLLASRPTPVVFLRSKDLLDAAMRAILPLEQAGRHVQTVFLNTLP